MERKVKSLTIFFSIILVALVIFVLVATIRSFLKSTDASSTTADQVNCAAAQNIDKPECAASTTAK